MDASGKALVTGASRGIGRAVAMELSSRGFEVLAGVRQPADAEALLQDCPALTPVELDVTKLGSFQPPRDLCVLVNNAGADDEHLPLEHDSMEAWRRVFDTNVFGLAAMTQAVIPELRRGGGGVIANITSISLLAPVPFYALYRASKAAVAALGESLRCELAPFGIRMLEILPGPIDTDMLAASGAEPGATSFAAYAAAAQLGHAGRGAIEELKTSAPIAASRIVDAILDDGAPLKVGCDPLGVEMLKAWRAGTEEEYQRSYYPMFVPSS